MGELINAGFELVQVREYDVTDYYSTPEDLIFLLKHTPIIPKFGEEEEDFTILEKFIDTNSSEKDSYEFKKIYDYCCKILMYFIVKAAFRLRKGSFYMEIMQGKLKK